MSQNCVVLMQEDDIVRYVGTAGLRRTKIFQSAKVEVTSWLLPIDGFEGNEGSD